MEPDPNSRFTEIGRVGRPRGLEGVFRFLPNNRLVSHTVEPNQIVYIKNERSDLIPARIESVHIEEKRNKTTFFVKLDMITNRSDAEAANDKALFSADTIDYQTEEEYDSTDFIGFDISYDGSVIGSVLDVMENPAHPILEVKYEGGSLLIPYVDEFIEKTDTDNRTIYCKNMDQLIDV